MSAALLAPLPAAHARGNDSIRLAVIQLTGLPGTPEARADRAIALIRTAAARGARYIVFPEFALFAPPKAARKSVEVPRVAEPVPGPLTRRMQAVARALKVHLAFGMVERRGDKIYNSVVFLGPEGVDAVYAKRSPIKMGPPGETEAELYTAGTDPQVVTWGGIKTGVLICADSASDEVWAEAAEGTRLIVWPKSSWGDTAERAVGQAQKFGIPIAVANTSFPDAEFPSFWGQSRILDGKGAELARVSDEPDAILIADVRLKTVPADVRATPPGR